MALLYYRNTITTEGVSFPLEPILSKAEEAIQLSPKKPKLTMKFLCTIIEEIQLENASLVQRLSLIERQLDEINHTRAEIAAANEKLQIDEQLKKQAQEIQVQENEERGIRVSRADRHTSNRKKSFWFLR